MDLETLYEIGLKIVSLAQVFYDFLFQEIIIGNWTFSMWELLGGAGLIILITANLIKNLIPVA
jgi:hypothetical protein